jgi:PleD family two-component response regulator
MSNRWVDLKMERPTNDYLSKDVGIARCEVDAVVRRGQDSTPLHVRGGGSSGESRAKHVLAVDDDPAVRAMITDYLVDHNLRVSAAADGREMWRVLTAGGVDLVILDLKLGDEDGLDLLRSLRADSLRALRLLENCALGGGLSRTVVRDRAAPHAERDRPPR